MGPRLPNSCKPSLRYRKDGDCGRASPAKHQSPTMPAMEHHNLTISNTDGEAHADADAVHAVNQVAKRKLTLIFAANVADGTHGSVHVRCCANSSSARRRQHSSGGDDVM